METLAVASIIFVAIWFGAIGGHRAGAVKAVLWVLLGVFIWAVGFYITSIIVEQLLLLAGNAIAPNGIYILSRLVGISAGVGLCYLFYWFITRQDRTVRATPSTQA